MGNSNPCASLRKISGSETQPTAKWKPWSFYHLMEKNIVNSKEKKLSDTKFILKVISFNKTVERKVEIPAFILKRSTKLYCTVKPREAYCIYILPYNVIQCMEILSQIYEKVPLFPSFSKECATFQFRICID